MIIISLTEKRKKEEGKKKAPLDLVNPNAAAELGLADDVVGASVSSTRGIPWQDNKIANCNNSRKKCFSSSTSARLFIYSVTNEETRQKINIFPFCLLLLFLLHSRQVNKRFVTSYLNVQGKLYTKIGMETFQECGRQMLREFRALLQQTPLPVNATRLLQLLALNMFAVSNTQLKGMRNV